MRPSLLIVAVAGLLAATGPAPGQTGAPGGVARGGDGDAPEAAAPVDDAPAEETLPEGVPGGTDAVTALREGNRLFRGGLLEQAEAAYRTGWDPDRPHPLLAYNLATTLHHRGELPEAILWYRRAEEADDPWRVENLDLARRTLGAPRAAAPSWSSTLADRLPLWIVAAVAAAWAVPLALFVPGRRGALLAAFLAGLALATGALWWWSATRAPLEVVLLEECRGAAADLPAGTETRAEPTADGWRIAGLGLDCPRSAAAAVHPR